jgi:predicted GTPase
MAQRALILGAAGRDFHNFNTVFRGNDAYEVVAFTAAQIPDIEGRRYPAVLAGAGYPDGIPIHAEAELESLIAEHEVDVVVFAYSDVTHEHVMHLGSRAMAAGANYLLLGARQTMIPSSKPVVAICAARTGSGKSQTSRRVAELLTAAGKKVVVIRHPMPYGDLAKQAVQRFETYEDLHRHDVTIEEREEYEPHIDAGRIVYAGVDYGAILEQAEQEADVVIWDGGNNDLPFYAPDVLITVVDPHRPEHALRYHPGATSTCSTAATGTSPNTSLSLSRQHRFHTSRTAAIRRRWRARNTRTAFRSVMRASWTTFCPVAISTR